MKFKESNELPDVNWDRNRIDECFPYKEYREGQREAIEFAVDAFDNGKQIVILECPTGSGKSGIAMTLAEMANTSYYLTITKILQDQLVRDFGRSPTSLIHNRTSQIIELKGRGTHNCTFYDLHGKRYVDKKLMSQNRLDYYTEKPHNCNNGFCRTVLCPDDGKCESCFINLPPNVIYSTCPYYEQVYKAINARKVVMNFSSFLYQTYFTTRFNVRDLITLDEAHNAEKELLSFVSLFLNDTHLRGSGITIPNLKSAAEYALYFDKVGVHDHLKDLLMRAKADENNKLEDEISNVIYKFELFMSNISRPDSEWIHEHVKDKKFNSVTMKPVHAMNFPDELLFAYAKKALLMSATILDVDIICKSLGIPRNKVAAYRMRNRFPVKNRPIYLRTVAKMTGGKNNMHSWAPQLTKEVNKIVKSYKGKRGIIHTHNFAIMEHLLENCIPEVRVRMLCQRDFRDKLEMLDAHGLREDSIIVAPAMHEGIDLMGDLSRFQIIAKVPFPNFYDDKQLARRIEIDRSFYDWLVALKIVQSYGRSIRSKDDYADTYILDESIYRFMNKTKHMLPEWFKEAILKE